LWRRILKWKPYAMGELEFAHCDANYEDGAIISRRGGVRIPS